MTLSYTAEVATCRGFGCFLKLLLRWHGSIYKMVWMDLIVFLVLYYSLSCVYHFALDNSQKEVFESLVRYCNSYGSLIPLSFVLGFYVSVVMKRWWDQYMTIPWPDPIAVYISSLVHGQDERGRVMRRTIMRYVCLCLTMVLGNMCPRVKKRFPTMDYLVDAGLLQENEKTVLEHFDQRFPKHSKHWMPIVWSASIVKRARKEGRIRDDFAVKTIIDELNRFRGSCGMLLNYDIISIPLVYTQVVTLAVYSYFLCSIMGKQWIERSDLDHYYDQVDSYFPLFTTLEFFFYVGWLKVAESLINPFGNDDDDFEINWLIDRNLQVSYLIVDEMHHEHPELVRDQYWDEVFPNELPYANDADGKREQPPEPSTAKLGLSNSKTDGASSHGRSRPGSTHTVSSCQVSLSRLNSAFKSLLCRQDTDNFEGHGSQSKPNSFRSLKSSSRESSNLVAVVYPIQKKSSSGRVRIASEFVGDQEEQDNTRTLINPEEQSYDTTPSIYEIFRQKPIGSQEQGSTSDDSLRTIGQPEGGSAAEMDDFDRLREERERQRQQRQMENIARTVHNAASVTVAQISRTGTSRTVPRDREASIIAGEQAIQGAKEEKSEKESDAE